MTVLANITHETGDLSQYTSYVDDSGDLSVAAGAALAGTGYGLSLVLDDSTAIYGRKDLTKATSIRYRFYIDPNTLTMGEGEAFMVDNLLQTAGSYYAIISLQMSWTSAGGYSLGLRVRDDANATPFSDNKAITDAPHYVEIYLVRAASDVSADGSAQWWVDGVDQGNYTTLDNYNRMIDQNWRFVLGATADIDAGTSGTFYLDELVINDDGGAIGPVASGPVVPVLRHHYAFMDR